MARVLAYTHPARGHLFPLVPILLELQRRGHEIHLRTLSTELATIEGLGFDVKPIDPAIEHIEQTDYLARSQTGALKRVVHMLCERATYEVPDLQRAIEDVQPELLLVDADAWGGLAAAESWGGRWAVWFPYPIPLPSRDVPPFGAGLKPARGPLGRLRDRLLKPVVFGTVERIVRSRLNEVRSGVGLPALANAADLCLAPPLLLYLTAEPFEYPRSDWPSNIRQVGACDWDPPAPPPEWLDELDAPLVLVTTSSEYQADEQLVRCALEALEPEPVAVVATVPSMDPGAFASTRNGRVLRFAPHSPLIERAACVVTHGGMGATQKALARGVPVCAVPFGRDQYEVARRLELAGAGTRLPAKRLRPDRLRAKVREAMSCREGARRVADGYRAAGGASAAAEALEDLLAAPSGPAVRT